MKHQSSHLRTADTIFVAKHPVTKPNLNIIKQHEHNLDEVIDDLMKTAIETTEKIIVK